MRGLAKRARFAESACWTMKLHGGAWIVPGPHWSESEYLGLLRRGWDDSHCLLGGLCFWANPRSYSNVIRGGFGQYFGEWKESRECILYIWYRVLILGIRQVLFWPLWRNMTELSKAAHSETRVDNRNRVGWLWVRENGCNVHPLGISPPLPICDVISSLMWHPELNRVTTGDDLRLLSPALSLVYSGLAKWGLNSWVACQKLHWR